jgi:hypothetical protein
MQPKQLNNENFAGWFGYLFAKNKNFQKMKNIIFTSVALLLLTGTALNLFN